MDPVGAAVTLRFFESNLLMTRLAGKLLLALYRGLPEWFVRNLVFLIVGFAFAVAYGLIMLRPTLRRIRSGLKRS